MHRLVLFALLAFLIAPRAQSQTLDVVLGKAGQFVIDLQKVRVLAADETYQQVYRVSGDANHAVSTGSAPPLGEWTGHSPRKIRSQFILLSNADSDVGWLAFRDAFEVDGRKLRNDQGRLEPMFARSIDTALPAAQMFTAEAIKHNKGTMAGAVHATTFALTVLSPTHQSSFKFEKKGEKKVGDVTAWVVAYAETTGGKFARTIEGVPQPVRGELWIDPATGRVLKTQVVMDSLDAYPDMKLHPERYENFPRMTFEVTYALDARLNLWLPRELKESYDRRVEVVTTTATYTNYRIVDAK
jgi:hypothetical protein